MARVSLRLAAALLVVLVAVYVGFPLYWKLSATIQEIREKRHTVREGSQRPSLPPSSSAAVPLSSHLARSPYPGVLAGISQLVLEAQRSVGWFYDESDSGVADDAPGRAAGTIPSRRRLTGAA